MIPWISLTAGAVALLLVAERRRSMLLRWIAKPLASTGFVGAALAAGAPGSTYGRLLMCALALSWLGDVLLIPKVPAAFRAGLLVFLLGHVAYGAAFLVLGVDPVWVASACVVLGFGAALVGRWLVPRVRPEKLRGAVVAYIGVITAMVTLAAGAVGAGATPVMLLAALLFYGSDVTVAVNRFVDEGFLIRALGLPAYYAAQLLFAWTAGALT